MISDKPINFDRFVRWLIVIAALVGAFFLLRSLSAVLLPFLLAWLTAYLLNPLVKRVQRWISNRALAVMATLLMLTLVATLLLLIMVPLMADEVQHLYSLVDHQLQNLEWPAWMPRDLMQRAQTYLKNIDVSTILQQEGVTDKLASGLGAIWNAISGMYGILGAIFGVITYLLYLVFIMIDYEEISEGWIDYVPRKYRDRAKKLIDDIEGGMNGYFRAQTKIVVIVAIMFAVGFKVIGLPFGIILGIAVGLLNYVPYLQIAGMVPALLFGALHALESNQNFWVAIGLVLLVFVIVQLAQDAYITPKIMGDLTGFNPAIVLLSLSIWGSLLGMVGLIIAIPLTSLLQTYYHQYILKRKPKEPPGATKVPSE